MKFASLLAAIVAAALAAGCQKTGSSIQNLVQSDAAYAVEVLAKAPDHGFAPGAFQEQELVRLSRSGSAKDRARRDLLLRGALISYAEAMHGQGMPKSAFRTEWGLRPAAYDAEAELDAAVAAGKLKAWIAAQAPNSDGYRSLQLAFVEYRQLSDRGGWPVLPGGPGVKVGQRDDRVALLRARLAAEDPAVALDGSTDGALPSAVARFQIVHGLPSTGVVDAETLKELDVPAKVRAEQIRANLERLRWLPREEPATRIDVNTAAATFDYYDNGRPALHMLVASGKPGDETPMLASEISSIVLNPPWNVPESIARDELYPKEAAQPGYLAANNYVTSDDGSRLVQQPGPDSALGLVKFDFKNPYSVYLHDTPSKAAFARTNRAVSHGCVRLEHAVAFAKLLLSQKAGWSEARVDEVLAAGETTHVALDRKVPVRLLYLTAFPEGGRIAFRRDVYGWDADLLSRLDRASAGRSLALLDMRAPAPVQRRGA